MPFDIVLAPEAVEGKPAGVLIGFESEEDWFDCRLETRVFQRVEQARNSLRAGGAIRLEDVETH